MEGGGESGSTPSWILEKIKIEKQVSDGLDGRDSIPGTGNKLFAIPQQQLIK
jgi:hypothetical protein